MEKFTNEELLEVLPTNVRESKELTTKQKVVLGQLIIYSGLDKKNSEGYFFRSNKDLTNDCDIQEKTLIAAINKLVMLGFIDTVRGTRKNNRASLYRINQKTIDDYCKTIVDDYSKKENENYSNDYSEIITAMHVRITELEITVKNLVERITVIESRNYSTDTDKEIELDKEKELLNNNILNNTSFNNILGETESNQELETIDSEENNLSESQLVSNESENSKLNQSQLESNEIPAEVLVSTNELDNINDQTDADEPSSIEELLSIDESYVPTAEEKEIWKGCLNIMNPYLSKMQSVTSRMIVDGIKDEIVCKVKNYFNSIDGVTDWVIMVFSKRLTEYTHARYDELEELNKKQREKQLQQSSRYSDLY
jgi:hypothetical protein